MTVTHGLASTYRSKFACRCPACTRANTERTRREKLDRQARLAEMFHELPHGSTATYCNWGCRCDDCCAAQSRKNAEYRRLHPRPGH